MRSPNLLQKTTEIIPVNIGQLHPVKRSWPGRWSKLKLKLRPAPGVRKPNSDPYKSNTLAVSPSPRFSEQIATYLRLNELPLSILIRSCLGGALRSRLGKIRKLQFHDEGPHSPLAILCGEIPLNSQPQLIHNFYEKWKIFNVLFQSRLTTD